MDGWIRASVCGLTRAAFLSSPFPFFFHLLLTLLALPPFVPIISLPLPAPGRAPRRQRQRRASAVTDIAASDPTPPAATAAAAAPSAAAGRDAVAAAARRGPWRQGQRAAAAEGWHRLAIAPGQWRWRRRRSTPVGGLRHSAQRPPDARLKQKDRIKEGRKEGRKEGKRRETEGELGSRET